MARKQFLSWLLGRFLSAHDREEQGYAPNPSGLSGNHSASRPTLTTTDVSTLVPYNDKLLVFRSLTGIDTVPALHKGHATRTAPNIGIYSRVVHSERSAARRYRAFNWLVNACLGIQIVVAAILTSLGAADGPRAAVTGFGAVNTIIAGIMTYLKGSGLPDRFRYHENEWKGVREYIEQREREFCLAGCPLDVREEAQLVEDMYGAVKVELEANGNPGSNNGGGAQERRASRLHRADSHAHAHTHVHEASKCGECAKGSAADEKP